MALTLPDWAVKGLHYLGYEFPQTNEDVLHEWAGTLQSMSAEFANTTATLDGALAHLRSHNQGPGLDAFVAMAGADTADRATLQRFDDATDIAAHACEICATAVVILKGVVIAQAIAAVPAALGGPLTFGAKKAMEYAIDRAIDRCIDTVLGEG